MTTNLRATAARIIYEVIVNGRSLADLLPENSSTINDVRNKALLQAICFGVCRWYFRLGAIAQLLLEKPLKEKDQDIYILLLVGLYQLIYMRIPAYAAVADTVAATKDFKKLWAKGLVNAVLRNYQRRADEFNNCSIEDIGEIGFYAHPQWLIDKIKQYYPQDWESVLIANNQHPPFTLRVNTRQINREKYIEKLAAAGIQAKIIPETHSGILLAEAFDVHQLPGFSQGDISVQDGAAQKAAELLKLAPGQRVLDACAAPGGKTTHILELQPDVELIAVDQDAVRLESVKENLKRLNLSATCLAADAVDTQKWWDGKLFDRILLDAPCSATGVIRRHPDIKLLRRATDIPGLVEAQLRLLKAMWSMLKPGGILLYATCSIFADENTLVLKRFAAEAADVKEDVIDADWGQACQIGKQILPGMHEMDGFYFARLRK